MKSFISDREFKILVDGQLSTLVLSPTNGGVPQGTILAPLLYNLYVSDLDHFLGPDSNVHIKQYADDIILYTCFSNQQTHKIHSLQTSIDDAGLWSESKRLNISHHKCRTLHLGPSNPKNVYHINDTPIEQVTDNILSTLAFISLLHLKFNSHINIKSRNAFKRWFSLTRYFKNASSSTLVYLPIQTFR
jgi:hypothetical protein